MIICGTCSKKIDSMAEMGDHIDDSGHEEYRTQDGLIVPWEIRVYLMAGAKFCTDCNLNFTNNYRLYEHLISTGHSKDILLSHAKSEKIQLDKLEQEWFYGRPNIPYIRKPSVGQDGNLLVLCPECEKWYKSPYFMDTDFDKWKPDIQMFIMSCTLCGVTTNTPNQNIRLRQIVDEEKIQELETKLSKYTAKYGDLE